jgi:hypothetical protein
LGSRNAHYRSLSGSQRFLSLTRYLALWLACCYEPFRPTGVCVADHYFRDESCARSTERSLTVSASRVRDNSEDPRVKGSQDTLLTRRPGRCRKPGNFFQRKGERGRDYKEHPYWFGQGTTHSSL